MQGIGELSLDENQEVTFDKRVNLKYLSYIRFGTMEKPVVYTYSVGMFARTIASRAVYGESD